MAGHPARMQNKNPDRRCSECKQSFTPDPRVGDRQVTCGAATCQRSRHDDRCRAWRAANSETVSAHYQDVVVAFRERQPDYQRRWRLARRVREIREKMRPLGGALRSRLRALLRGETVEAEGGVMQMGQPPSMAPER